MKYIYLIGTTSPIDKLTLESDQPLKEKYACELIPSGKEMGWYLLKKFEQMVEEEIKMI